MRNLKKFLALVLAMLMIVSASAVVSASDFADVADDSIYAEAIADLVEKGITNGVAEGQFGPDQPVQRFQMALFMARALEPDVDDWMTGMQVFTDVNEWYGAIAYAYVNGIVTGMGDGIFAPHDGIRYQDALIMALRALGYTVDVSGDPYWLAAYNQAQAIGLTKGVEVYVGEQVLTRAETAQIIYNMLYTVPADGGLTIAAKNFGEQTAANTTTMVVTATPEQYYAETYKAAQDGYLGLQAIVDGLPAGDVYYYTADELGIDEDEIESYFGYAFDFVNFVAETGKYDRVIIGADPVVVYNSDVTKNADDKLTIDGTVYYTVDEFTGAALKNEIVILNAGELAYAKKVLYTNADGDVVNAEGKIVADYSHKSSSGTKFYAVTALGVEQSTGLKLDQIITEQEALQVFGIGDSDESYINYSTLSAKNIADSGNYQMTLFDDDRDGKFERAIVTTVWVNAFKAKESGKETFGAMKGEEGVVYTEDLTKGDVFTYTYNSQTKVVTVLDILPIQTGILTKINTTGIGDKVVKLTIDGEVYTLANDGIVGSTGANINLNGKNNAVEFEKIATECELGYLYNKNDNSGWNELIVGSRINFYAIGDYIINAKTYDIDANYTRVILKDIVSYDSKNIYVDLYKDGKLEKNVAIESVDGDLIADLNIFELSRLLSDDMWESGNLFRYIELSDDTYELSAPFAGIAKLGARDETFGLTRYNSTKMIKFVDGIVDTLVEDNGTERPYNDNGNAIRTNDDTIFYFIDEKGNVNIYIGAPDNSTIDFRNDSSIALYADKIGYGSASTNGVASFIAVYYNSKDANLISGFGFTSVDSSVVFISKSAAVNKYERVNAGYIGLGTGYSGTYYSYDVDNLGVDLGTGAEVNKLYSKYPLVAGKFYSVDTNNVVEVTADGKALVEVTPKSAYLSANSFKPARYYTIDGIIGANGVVETPDLIDRDDAKIAKVILAKFKFDGNFATDNFDWFGKTSYYVYYIEDYADGVFVGIVDIDDDSENTPVTGTSNANWYVDKETVNGAIATVKSDGTASIQLYTDGVNSDLVNKVPATDKVNATPNYKMYYQKIGTNGLLGDKVQIGVDASYDAGVLTVNGFKNEIGNKYELTTGEYQIVVAFTNASNQRVYVTYYVTID